MSGRRNHGRNITPLPQVPDAMVLAYLNAFDPPEGEHEWDSVDQYLTWANDLMNETSGISEYMRGPAPTDKENQ